MKLTLKNYWRSSASHRVRIALGLKGLKYEYEAVNILADEQHRPSYVDQNTMAQVPTLVIHDGSKVTGLVQSLPILEYLEETFPEPPLLPKSPRLRAHIRALCEIVNSGIQPLQNLTTTKQVKAFGGDPAAWTRHFIAKGLVAFEKAAAHLVGEFCVGDDPTFADCFLVPQLASARRFGVDLAEHARLVEIETHCLALPAFAAAMPDQQPDAVK